MKGGVAAFLSAALRVARGDAGDPAGDLVVVVLADEEAGGDDGAAFLVEEHPGVFDGVDYAIGEFGGFAVELGGERLYPVQTDEKTVCWSRLTFRGPAGHASVPRSGGAMADMARAVAALDGGRLPTHVTPTVRWAVERTADAVGGETGERLRALLDPERTEAALSALGEDGDFFAPLLSDTAVPTVVRGGETENVVPGEVRLTLDCRLLPGRTDDDLERELRAAIPEEVDFEFETVRYEPFPTGTDDALFDLLAGVLEDADPGATAVPFVLFAGTDARHLARVGVQSYGFTPMDLPPDFDFLETVHAADERIPVECVAFGADRVFELLDRYDADAVDRG